MRLIVSITRPTGWLAYRWNLSLSRKKVIHLHYFGLL